MVDSRGVDAQAFQLAVHPRVQLDAAGEAQQLFGAGELGGAGEGGVGQGQVAGVGRLHTADCKCFLGDGVVFHSHIRQSGHAFEIRHGLIPDHADGLGLPGQQEETVCAGVPRAVEGVVHRPGVQRCGPAAGDPGAVLSIPPVLQGDGGVIAVGQGQQHAALEVDGHLHTGGQLVAGPGSKERARLNALVGRPAEGVCGASRQSLDAARVIVTPDPGGCGFAGR